MTRKIRTETNAPNHPHRDHMVEDELPVVRAAFLEAEDQDLYGSLAR
jgi:hypothetical protein